MSQVDLPPEQKEGLEETYERSSSRATSPSALACAAQNECCNNDVSPGLWQALPASRRAWW